MKRYNVKGMAFEHIRARKRSRRWPKVIVALAVPVAITTALLLMLPALTMEHEIKTLVCQPEIHTHTNDCIDGNDAIICGYADFIVHTHQDLCYNDSGALICPLEEIGLHTHDASCYQQVRVLVLSLIHI